MSPGNDFDQERSAELADVAHVVDGLDPELVDADGLRHHDLDIQQLSFLTRDAPTMTPAGVTTRMNVVEMVAADKVQAGERRLDVVDVGLDPLILLDFQDDQGIGRPIPRAVWSVSV